MSIADKLIQLNTTKQNIKQAIINKGVSMAGVPFTQYHTKIAEISGGGLTGGYSVVYRSNYYPYDPSWISITLTFVDDTTASYEIKQGGNFPSDWEEQTGNEAGNGNMDSNGPYVWNNVKSVSITSNALGLPPSTEPYLVINGKKIWHSAYNKTLDRNILVSQSFGSHAGGGN